MTDSPFQWARKCSTKRLNSYLSEADRPPDDNARIHLTPEALRAVQAEKDRRLADPNSSDFRPTFF